MRVLNFHGCQDAVSGIGSCLMRGPQVRLGDPSHFNRAAPQFFKYPDQVERTHIAGRRYPNTVFMLAIELQGSNGKLGDILARNPRQLLRSLSENGGFAVVVIEAELRGEPGLHKESGLENYIVHAVRLESCAGFGARANEGARCRKVLRHRNINKSPDAENTRQLDQATHTGWIQGWPVTRRHHGRISANYGLRVLARGSNRSAFAQVGYKGVDVEAF